MLDLYSLRPELLVAEIDVSRCILVLDTSISTTSNSGWRQYKANSVVWKNAYLTLVIRVAHRCLHVLLVCRLIHHKKRKNLIIFLPGRMDLAFNMEEPDYKPLVVFMH